MGLTRLSHDLRLPAAVLILAYFLLYGLAVLAVSAAAPTRAFLAYWSMQNSP